MTTRILFVDDDEFLLAAMRRLVWSYDDEWDCEFAEGGPSALEALADEEFDVVVSDMRMPGMDGAELLSRVRLLCPNTIRIVLSGQSDREYAFHAIGPVQLFLNKPCNANELKRVITRAMGLKEFLSLGNANDFDDMFFGEFPQLAARVNTVLEGKSSSDDIVLAMNMSSEMSGLLTKTLDTVLPIESSLHSPEEVVSRVGVEAMRPLLLAVSIYTDFANSPQEAIEEVLRKTVRPALLAREITNVETGNSEMADQAMLGGLLKGLAELLVKERPNDEDSANDKSVAAALLLRKWGFSIPVVESVAFHKCPQAVADEGFSPLAAIYAADCICRDEFDGDSSMFFESRGLEDRFAVWTDFAESS